MLKTRGPGRVPAGHGHLETQAKSGNGGEKVWVVGDLGKSHEL